MRAAAAGSAGLWTFSIPEPAFRSPNPDAEGRLPFVYKGDPLRRGAR